jgi:hypothetical protein
MATQRISIAAFQVEKSARYPICPKQYTKRNKPKSIAPIENIIPSACFPPRVTKKGISRKA